MRTTLGNIRRIIEAGLDADMRNMAGSAMDIGTSVAHANDDADDDDAPEQEKSQPGARYVDRRGRE